MKTLIITAFLIALSTGCDVPPDVAVPNSTPSTSPFAGVETHGSVDTAPEGIVGDAAVIPGPVMVDELPTTLVGNGAQGPAQPPVNGPLFGDAGFGGVSYSINEDQTANTITVIRMSLSNVQCDHWERPKTWQDMLQPPVNHVDTEPRCGEL